MNRVFRIDPPFRVPDGTWVSPFLNAKDSQSDLPFDLLDGFSIAAGRIEPGTSSRIHIMPLVSQVTFVQRGPLVVKMKGSVDLQPYQLCLAKAQAALTEPGTYFQLINDGAEVCDVLYIVSPAYVFEMSADGQVIYDDSLVLEEDWDQLAAVEWKLALPLPIHKQRNEAMERLRFRKRQGAMR